MRGDFDVNKSAWPIGYLKHAGFDTPMYVLTDMRSLEPVVNQPIPLHIAEQYASTLNAEIRAGHIKDDAAIVAKAALLVLGK